MTSSGNGVARLRLARLRRAVRRRGRRLTDRACRASRRLTESGAHGLPARRRDAVLPRARGAGPRAWRERDVFRRSLAQRADAEVWSFYEGPPTANGAARVTPRPLAGVQGHLPALPDDARLPRAQEGRMGLPRPAGGARGREGARDLLEGRDRGLRDRRVQPALPGVRVPLRRGLGAADRADRLLDRPRRRLRDARQLTTSSRCGGRCERSGTTGGSIRRHKVVPYCPRGGTALSSHEVAQGYHDVEDPSVYVSLPVREP